MASTTPVPANLPQRAAQTTPDHPWPLRLLSVKIREYVAKMSRLWVEGEVITLQRRPGAKVQFLTLRDLEENVSMTVKILSHLLPATVTSGSRVVVWAVPDFYTGNGSLSLWAQEIRPVGVGDILARLERKKPLPFLPRAVGLIVGRNTKAKEDVIINASLRWPGVRFEVREVAVQGRDAVAQMIPALRELDAHPGVDVIVLARGGGSVEDLLPFSDEHLVRAIAATRTPVVSAIGHEGDNPISDYVADLRASTPTDAAKRIVPDREAEREGVQAAVRRLRQGMRHRVDRATKELEALRARPVLARPRTMVEVREQDIHSLRSWLQAHIRRDMASNSQDISSLLSQLRALSPQATLQRGYSVILSGDDRVVSQENDVRIGEHLRAILAAGTLHLEVKGSAHGS